MDSFSTSIAVKEKGAKDSSSCFPQRSLRFGCTALARSPHGPGLFVDDGKVAVEKMYDYQKEMGYSEFI